MSWRKRALAWLRRQREVNDELQALQPHVTPTPEAARDLEERRARLAYRPTHGFLLERWIKRKPTTSGDDET